MKNEVLKILKSENNYISGAEIAEKLGVSRTYIWKMISKLKEEGYIIDAINNKGYKIIDDKDIINKMEISSILETKFLGKNLIYLDSTNSTNEILKLEAENNVPDGTVIISNMQTKGKGRMGREWNSEKNVGIYLSILLKPNIDPRKSPIITLLAGISVCEACREITELDIKLKWPNDIIYKNKKISGILTEMNSEIQSINYIIVGIGVNVNNSKFPNNIENIATSLSKESGKKIKRKILIAKILKNFENYYIEYIKDCNFLKFINKYKYLCDTINKEINVISIDKKYEATAINISENGELIIQRNNGKIEKIFSGEISIRNKNIGDEI